MQIKIQSPIVPKISRVLKRIIACYSADKYKYNQKWKFNHTHCKVPQILTESLVNQRTNTNTNTNEHSNTPMAGFPTDWHSTTGGLEDQSSCRWTIASYCPAQVYFYLLLCYICIRYCVCICILPRTITFCHKWCKKLFFLLAYPHHHFLTYCIKDL